MASKPGWVNPDCAHSFPSSAFFSTHRNKKEVQLDFIRVDGGVVTPSGTIAESIFVDRGPTPGTHLIKRPRDGSRTVITTDELLRRIRFIELRIMFLCVKNMIQEIGKARSLKRRLKAASRREHIVARARADSPSDRAIQMKGNARE